MSLKIYFRYVFHALPLAPVLLNRPILVFAAILLVLLAYVKVFKLEQQIRERQEKHEGYLHLLRTRDFWLNLTFLSDDRIERGPGA